jgi:DNA modification methylase
MTQQIETFSVSDLIPYVNNARTHSEDQVAKIASSIKEFGFINPILIDNGNVIIAGHARLLAAKKIGLKTVPVLRVSHLSDLQRKAYILADNRIALDSGWDDDLLKVEIAFLKENDFDISLTGFSIDDFDFDPVLDTEGDEDVPEPPKDAKTKIGDIYDLGCHRLMCGDSTMIDDVQKLMDGVKADMVWTDPPYGVAYSARTGIGSGKVRPEMQMIMNDDLDKTQLLVFLKDVFAGLIAVSKENAPFYVCNNWHCADVFLKAYLDFNLKMNAWIIWNKEWMSLGHGHYRNNHEFIFYFARGGVTYADKGTQQDVWSVQKLCPTDKVHTTEKPVALVAMAIDNSSKKNDVVLDLFGGSGSCLMACEKTNRKNMSMELDPKYCDVIVKRYINFCEKNNLAREIKVNGENLEKLKFVGS